MKGKTTIEISGYITSAPSRLESVQIKWRREWRGKVGESFPSRATEEFV